MKATWGSRANSSTAASCFLRRSQRLWASDLASLPRLPEGLGGNGWQLFLSSRHDSAIAPLQSGIGLVIKAFIRALRNLLARLPQQVLQVARLGVAVGIDDARQFAQQMRATQAMPTVRLGEIGSPTVMNDRAPIAGNDADLLDGPLAPVSVQALQRGV